MINGKDIFEYKAVFFDLDGTLIDSAKDLSFAIDEMSHQMGFKKPGLSQVRSWIGQGTLQLVERALFYSDNQKPDEKQLNQAIHIFTKSYKKCVGEHSTTFEGTQKLLVKLLAENIKIACITNKPLEFTEFLLQQNMISQFFSIICAGDNVKQRKPHAWPLLYASEQLDVDINNCLMIGDSNSDITAAKNAGCDVIAVSYGYNQGQDINALKPNKVIDSFNQLI